MSLHISSHAAFSSRVPAGEFISRHLIEGVTPRSQPGPDTSEPATDRLSIRLETIGMVLSVTASDQVQTPTPAVQVAIGAGPESAGESAGVIQLRVDRGSTPVAHEDQVLQRLSRALAQLDGDESEFTGVCADALRLAIVTRTLSLRAQPAPERRPLSPPAQVVRSGLPTWRLKRVAAYVDENIGEAITLADMAAAAGLSRMHFAAQFRIATGVRPHEYVMRRRIDLAQRMLLETRASLVEIALNVGFQTQAHFTTVFRRFVGDTPYQWRCTNCRAQAA